MSGLACESLEDYLRQQPEFNDKALPEFDIHEWTQLVDSSDITSENWVELAQEIGDVRYPPSIAPQQETYMQAYLQ